MKPPQRQSPRNTRQGLSAAQVPLLWGSAPVLLVLLSPASGSRQ